MRAHMHMHTYTPWHESQKETCWGRVSVEQGKSEMGWRIWNVTTTCCLLVWNCSKGWSSLLWEHRPDLALCLSGSPARLPRHVKIWNTDDFEHRLRNTALRLPCGTNFPATLSLVLHVWGSKHSYQTGWRQLSRREAILRPDLADENQTHPFPVWCGSCSCFCCCDNQVSIISQAWKQILW